MTAAPGQPSGDVQALFRDAVGRVTAALAEGGGETRLGPAIGGFDRIVELDPGSPLGYLGRGYARALAGDSKLALDDLGHAIEVGGSLPQVYATRARVYERLGMLDEALSDYAAAVERSPDDPLLRRDRAAVRLGTGDSAGALEDLDAAARLEPSLLDVRRTRATILESLGRHEEAVADLDAVIAHGDAGAAVYRDRGNSRGAIGDAEGAIADFTAALERDPAMVDAYIARATAYSKVGRDEAAVADYSSALERDPALAKAYRRRGEALQRLGRAAEAAADFDRFIEVGRPNSAEAYCLRAGARAEAGDMEGALADYDDAIERDSSSLAAYLGRGHVHLKRGDPELARADYDAAVSVDPQCTDAYIGRAAAYQALGDAEQAMWDHARAIELDAGRVEAHRGVVLAWLAMGDDFEDRRLLGKADDAYRAALHGADDGLESAPDDRPLRVCRVAALRALGRCDRALEEIRAVIAASAAADPAALARLHAEAGRVLLQWGRLVERPDLLDDALGELERAFSGGDAETSASARELAGTALAERGRYDDALSLFETVAAQAPGMPGALLGAGRVHLLRGEPLDALAAFARLLEACAVRDTVERWARTGRALALRRLEDPGAKHAAKKAIKRDDAPSYVERGSRLEFFGAFEDAEQDFRSALRLAPGWGAAQHALARNIVERADATGPLLEEACRLASGAVEHHRTGASVPHYRQTAARACMRLGRHEDALEHMREATRLNPDHVGMRRDLRRAEELLRRAP